MQKALEQAKRLKAAGFPQDETREILIANEQYAYSPDAWTPIARVEFAFYAEPETLRSLAHPNSDELLADIQRRWPKVSWHGWSIPSHPSVYIYYTKPAGDSGPSFGGITLRDVLIELYCALAQGDEVDG